MVAKAAIQLGRQVGKQHMTKAYFDYLAATNTTNHKEETMAEYPNHEAFFEANHDLSVSLRSWGIERTVTVEELYQHFKERMLAELESEVLPFEQEDSATL
jgi:hypothetical protein